MNWIKYRELLKSALDKKALITDDLPDIGSFLLKTKLVVSLETKQVSFENAFSLKGLLKEMDGLDIILASSTRKVLDCLKKKIEMIEQQYQEGKINEASRADKIALTDAELNGISLDGIEIADEINVEMIFPNVTMPTIQRLKQHPAVNQQKTCQCMACIRVYLV